MIIYSYTLLNHAIINNIINLLQTAHLLQTRKNNPDNITNITTTYFKLNSLQLKKLLQKYIPEPNEPPIPQQLLKNIIKIAKNITNKQIKSNEKKIYLKKNTNLQLPFLLPKNDYTYNTIKKIPKNIEKFIDPLTKNNKYKLISTSTI